MRVNIHRFIVHVGQGFQTFAKRTCLPHVPAQDFVVVLLPVRQLFVSTQAWVLFFCAFFPILTLFLQFGVSPLSHSRGSAHIVLYTASLCYQETKFKLHLFEMISYNYFTLNYFCWKKKNNSWCQRQHEK